MALAVERIARQRARRGQRAGEQAVTVEGLPAQVELGAGLRNRAAVVGAAPQAGHAGDRVRPRLRQLVALGQRAEHGVRADFEQDIAVSAGVRQRFGKAHGLAAWALQ